MARSFLCNLSLADGNQLKKGGEKGTGEGSGDRKRWRDMNDEEKAAAKAKRESMTDEEKAAAKARREKKGIE